MDKYSIFVAGHECAANSGKYFDVLNPGTEEVARSGKVLSPKPKARAIVSFLSKSRHLGGVDSFARN